jgi:hypothetical protein
VYRSCRNAKRWISHANYGTEFPGRSRGRCGPNYRGRRFCVKYNRSSPILSRAKSSFRQYHGRHFLQPRVSPNSCFSFKSLSFPFFPSFPAFQTSSSLFTLPFASIDYLLITSVILQFFEHLGGDFGKSDNTTQGHDRFAKFPTL